MSPCEIRRIFNTGPYPDMIADGRAQRDPIYLRDDHLTEPGKVNEPWCTRGQKIRYLDAGGRWLVTVFQYLRPDGRIGASGRSDPKRLVLPDGTILIVTTELPRQAR